MGDLVLAQDDTGERAWRQVTKTFKTADQEVVSLDLAGAEPAFVVTPGHPFWKDGAGWTGAGELLPGDHVWTLAGWREVESLASAGTAEYVYNLEVEDDHTYFVGEEGAWVHNACDGRPRTNLPQNKQARDAIRDYQRQTGRELSKGQRRQAHEEFQRADDPGYHDLVDILRGLFGG